MKLILLMLMALAPDQMTLMAAGDEAFYKVDTRRPPHELEPGVCADAVNKRFEDGRPWPRYGVNRQPWGDVSGNLILPGAVYAQFTDLYRRDGVLFPGRTYTFKNNSPNALTFQYLANSLPVTLTVILAGDSFTGPAQGDGFAVRLAAGHGKPVLASFVEVRPIHHCAFSRFNDPQGFDTLVLATDDVRDRAGEDGGRGRLWKFQAGNAPVAVPLNGHDIYGAARFVACHQGLVLLRQDNERHYFKGGAVAAASRLQLNCQPNWASGDLVVLVDDAPAGGVASSFTGVNPPVVSQPYYVKNIVGNLVELYSNASLTTQMTFTSALGRFYLERRATQPGFYGNGAPPLLAQPNAAGNTLWETGFTAVPVVVNITGTDNSSNIVTAPNHRLLAGDAVNCTGIHTTGPTNITTAYAAPMSEHTLKLYTNAEAALAAGTSSLIPLLNNGETGTIAKAGASGAPMPSGREGVYYQGVLMIANQRDNLIESDALDPLHCTPFNSGITANQGESDAVTAFATIGQDSVLVLKENSVLVLDNFSSGPDAQESVITREYGCFAPLSVAQCGADVWFLSRKGVASIFQTAQGILQGQSDPVSKPMKKYIDLIDWRHAAQAVAHYWNNRYFVAVPLKGQSGTVKNNGVLVYNFLNQGWEGLWQGAAVEVFGFARQVIYGEERLCFVNYDGQVCWFGDGFTDGATPISDSLTTRRYTNGNNGRKLFLSVAVVYDAYAPTVTVMAIAPGVNEASVLLNAKTYDKTKYQVYGQPDYDPTTATTDTWRAAHRADYSLAAGELLAGQLDTHQNTTENLRMRMRDWGMQFKITNTTGSCRLQSLRVEANDRNGTGSTAT